MCADFQRAENDGPDAKWRFWVEDAGWQAHTYAECHAEGKPETIFTTKGIEGFDKKIDTWRPGWYGRCSARALELCDFEGEKIQIKLGDWEWHQKVGTSGW